ncbi:MAG: hypothetical protein IKZ87_02340 [Actinomycetaceae bacterium]|nr:hypothetical protein [Actinomycetaceae bacterium]
MKKTANKPRFFSTLFLLLITTLTLSITTLPTPAYAQNVSSGSTTFTPSKKTGQSGHDGRVVLIMTGALQWEELDDYNAPRLRELAASGAVGNMIPLSVRGANCPLNSWLTLSAGAKKGNRSLSRTARCEVPTPVPGTQMGRYTCAHLVSAMNLALFHHTNLEDYGALSQALSQGDVTSYGIGTGAGYVLTSSANTYPYQWEEASDDNAQLGAQTREAALSYNLTVVDADISRLITDDDYPYFPEDDNFTAARKEYRDAFYMEQAHANAQRVESILRQLPDGTRVVVVSLLDKAGAHSQMTIIGDIGDTSPAFEAITPGLLYSASVQREGVLQLTDIDPTILSWFSLPRPEGMGGASLVDNPVSSSHSCAPDQHCFTDRLQRLVDDSSMFSLVRDIRHPFLNIFHYIAAFFFLGTILLTARPLWRRSFGKHAWARTFWVWLGYTLAALPMSAIIVNVHDWWRSAHPLALYAGLAWACAGFFALLAMAARRLHCLAPLFVVLMPTALLIVIDTATGTTIMADSAIGYNTLAAARFYGLGNEPYSLLAASSLFILSFLGLWLRERLTRSGKPPFVARGVAVTVVGIIGFIIAAIDALPGYGADFGGALSYIPALLVLLILISEAKITWHRASIITAVTIISAVLVAFADWLRPASSRTHLGNFFQSVLDGRLFSILGGKLETNLRLLTSSDYTLIVLRGVLLLFIVLLPALVYSSSRPLATPRNSEEQCRRCEGASATAATSNSSQSPSLWLRLKAGMWTFAQKIVVLHEHYWSWLFPRSSKEAATTRWPALRIAFIVEIVVFVLSFALNDSGIVLPAVAILLLLPLLTSFIMDGVGDMDNAVDTNEI